LALSEHLRFAEIDNIDPLLGSAALHADLWSDPRDESGYSAEDLFSLGFRASAPDAALVKKYIALGAPTWTPYDALFLVGGQSKITAVTCDVTCGAPPNRAAEHRCHRFLAPSSECWR
jgi:hypothetical protein